MQEHGGTLVVHYSIADQTTAGVVQRVFSSIVQQANQAAAGRTAAYQLQTAQVEDKSLKPIQYLAPGLLGWAIASGGAFGAAITLVELAARTSCCGGCGWPRSAPARSCWPGSG